MAKAEVKKEVVEEVAKTAVAATTEAAVIGVATGKIDYKKVAIVAGGTLLVAGGAYLAVRAYRKRKANTDKVETIEEIVITNDNTEECGDPTQAPKTEGPMAQLPKSAKKTK